METAVLRAERPDFALNTALPKRYGQTSISPQTRT